MFKNMFEKFNANVINFKLYLYEAARATSYLGLIVCPIIGLCVCPKREHIATTQELLHTHRLATKRSQN